MFDHAIGNKKMLNMLVLEVLKDYSDESHALTQQDILRKLKEDYGMECDRRSVKNNVEYLLDFGFDIDMGKDGYRLMSRDFDNVELQLLINSVVFSKSLSKTQAKALIGKLSRLGNCYFSPRVLHVSNFTDLQHTDNKQVMINLDIIDEAIEQKKKIRFIYNTYNTEFKMMKKRLEPFIFNPYQIVISNGRYYLVGNYDKYNTISHYRIDKMTDMEMLPEQAKDLASVDGMENGLNLPKHMAEHIYMFSGNTISVLLETKQSTMDELIDWFGRDFQVVKVDKDTGTMQVRIRCNENAMEYWALQYGLKVTILEPLALREKVKKDIAAMMDKYQEKES